MTARHRRRSSPLALSSLSSTIMMVMVVMILLGLVAECKPWGSLYRKQKDTYESSDDHTILGIDLGGKWVKAAVFQGKDVTVIEDDDNSRKEMSIVSFLANEGRTKTIQFERLFGRVAWRQLYKSPQRTFIYSTELLGRPFTAFSSPDVFHPYDVVAATLNSSRAGVHAALAPGLNVFSAEEVVGMLLRHVKQIAESSPRVTPGTRLSDCVIAVRSSVVTAQERTALVDASRLAGLNVIAVVSSTTASAIAYAKNKPVPVGKPRRMVIIDMGATALEAGIFDISETDKDEKKAQIPAYSGTVVPLGSFCDDSIGGRAFAARLANIILDEIGMGASPAQTLYYRAYATAEKVMEVLSVNTEAFYTLSLPERDYTGRITRKRFEDATKDLLARVPAVLRHALAAANINSAEIDDVQIVGGATRIPAVQAAIVETLGKKDLHTHISADEGACIGAAYLGAHINPTARMYIRRKVAVRDVVGAPVSLSLDMVQPSSPPLPPTTVFPAGSVVKSMKTVTLPVPEGAANNGVLSFTLAYPENEDATRCTEIARFSVVPQGASPAAALRVTVTLDLMGIPAVEKVSVAYGAEDVPPEDANFTVEHLCIAPLSSAEFAKAVQHLATLDSVDMEKRDLRKAKNDLEEYLLLVQRFLSDSPRAKKFAKPKELANLQKAVNSAEEWFEECPEEDGATKSEYEEKLAAVSTLGDKILIRESEAESRPHAVALLKHALVLAKGDLAAVPTKTADAKAIVEQLGKKCEATEKWMNDVLSKQASRALDEPPAFLTEDVDVKLEELRMVMVFAGYSDYPGNFYTNKGSTFEKQTAPTGPSVWTDYVTLDEPSEGGDEKAEL